MNGSEGVEGRIQASLPESDGRPPLEHWHPELSGDIDIRITRDGVWLYQGAPIARESIVRLFASVLRRESDGDYYLVTPVEKWRIRVDDTPLLAHSLSVTGDGAAQVLSLTTSVGETLAIGEDHPLTMGTYPGGEPRPVIAVRHGLDARMVTSAYYDLVGCVVESADDSDSTALGVWSGGKFWKIG
ncbi:DUF1285 domain-containing protein [Marinobacter sp. C2H3]|uniref:DUF1285 domain-containing protein n=1 Tax=Marinobacter sp. C2H3 TaxID=3119003 RepID=UPI00300F4CA4